MGKYNPNWTIAVLEDLVQFYSANDMDRSKEVGEELLRTVQHEARLASNDDDIRNIVSQRLN